MKIFISVCFAMLFILQSVYASGINQTAYRTIQLQAYQNRNNRYARTGAIPYWKAQSNFSTRNRVYGSYAQYDSIRQYNNSTPAARGYR